MTNAPIDGRLKAAELLRNEPLWRMLRWRSLHGELPNFLDQVYSLTQECALNSVYIPRREVTCRLSMAPPAFCIADAEYWVILVNILNTISYDLISPEIPYFSGMRDEEMVQLRIIASNDNRSYPAFPAYVAKIMTQRANMIGFSDFSDRIDFPIMMERAVGRFSVSSSAVLDSILEV